MKKLVTLFAALYSFAAVFAEPIKMPSKAELSAAKDAVEALLESGTTAEEFLEIAGATENGAERYHVYRCAFVLQAKDGKFAEAAETLKTFQTEVTGVPASEIVSLVDKNVGKKFKESKELQVVYSDAKAKVTAEKQIVKIKKEIKKNPKDPILKRSLAEATAISGDWPAALKEFEKADGEVADIVKAEKQGPNAKIAAFWWDYKPHKSFGATNAFKLHAAKLYSQLLNKGELSKIEQVLAEKRIEQAEELGAVVAEMSSDDIGNPNKRIISNTTGLVHRWTFNDTLADECGGYTAQIHGDDGCAEHKNGQITISGRNHIYLDGKSIPTDGSPITIELWARQNELSRWARILSFGQYKGTRFEATWCWDGDIKQQEILLSGACDEKVADLTPFDVGTEYHIAFVLFYKTDLKAANNKIWYLRGYKQDVKTGKTLGKFEIKLNDGFTLKDYPSELFHLGLSYCGSYWRSKASYNEVRVWKRALSEGELTDNAKRFYKAGETMKK